MQRLSHVVMSGIVLLALLLCSSLAFAQMKGAIFTTTYNGSRVNANIFQDRLDVYLDGGPQQKAPSTAAALDPGWYYFQVTDPSGKKLLSADPIGFRKILVSENGVIVDVVDPGATIKFEGKYWGKHLTHEDEFDHPEFNAITVQLMPFEKTPNPGGVYKVWVTPVAKYDPSNINSCFGFLHNWSKTDNFKVKGKPVPLIKVRKFEDVNGDECLDSGDLEIGVDELIDGDKWTYTSKDPNGAEESGTMPDTILAVPYGDWTITEGTCDEWALSYLYIDGVKQTTASLNALVKVIGTDGEEHTVIFGNVRLGALKVCKWRDYDFDGRKGDDDTPIAGWKMTLTGLTNAGKSVECFELTGEYGCVIFKDLWPGKYTVTEETKKCHFQTGLIVDGVDQPVCDTASVDISRDCLQHKIEFLNAKTWIYACKFYDKNLDGKWQTDCEPPIADWQIVLVPVDDEGNQNGALVTKYTDETGYVKFDCLKPGKYLVYEVMPACPCWVAITEKCQKVCLTDDHDKTFAFGNVCFEDVAFGTKGYWHNKNGLDEMGDDDIAFANGLLPYQAPSTYFTSGDEPFDGTFQNGDPVEEAKGPAGESYAAAGTPRAEVSLFLVESNGDSDKRGQLAQQLLAFIFNSRCRLGDVNTTFFSNGKRYVAIDVINVAIAIWNGGTSEEQTAMASLLDSFNNNHYIKVVSPEPCEVLYPVVD